MSIGDYLKVTSIPDVSASRVLHTCIPAKEIAETGSPILDRMKLGNMGRKNIFAGIVRS